MISHEILGGIARVYKRPESKIWQCAAFLEGRNYRVSTKEESLLRAKDFAEDWYLDMRGKARAGVLGEEREPTFEEMAEQFLKEYNVITEGQRSPRWAEGHAIRLRVHLIPFFGALRISKVNAGKAQEYRVLRMTPTETPNPHSKSNRKHKAKAPSLSTLHDEFITLRLVLKTAVRHDRLSALPDLSPPYKARGKIIHRPWFSPTEYKELYASTREYTKVAPTRFRWEAEQMHDFVLFMGNTGLRPDEALNLQHRDVEIVWDEATNEEILEIEVRGKRGVGYCKSMPGAVTPYKRLMKRAKPQKDEDSGIVAPAKELPKPTDHVFPGNHLKMFNGILKRTNLKFDRDGKARTAYSLRHTYICLRLMDGANIYEIAKNCRTSVEMIEKHYAAHIKNRLDASEINVRKPKPKKSKLKV